MERLRLGEAPSANPAVLGLCPCWRAQSRELTEANAPRSRTGETLAGPSGQASSDASSERMGFPEQSHGHALPPLECTTSLAAPCRKKGRRGKIRLACISAHLFDPAQRVRDRRKRSAGTTSARRYPDDDEHLYDGGPSASTSGEQQGRSASLSYRDVKTPFSCVPLCSLMRTQVGKRRLLQWDSPPIAV